MRVVHVETRICRRGLLGLLAGSVLSACKRPAAAPAKPSAEGEALLKKAAAEPGAKTLPSGLVYKVIRSGPADGPHPAKGDTIKINYTGSLTDGTVFDSTDKEGVPAVMPLDHLVPGWMEALPLMRPGDVWLLTLPPKLGYGEGGAGGVIPPGAVLVFRIELLGVLPGVHSGLA